MREKINQMIHAVYLNRSMKNAYHFTPPTHASGRRHYEGTHSCSFSFDDISVKMETSCSCRNVYFNQEIYVDGKKGTIRSVKKKLIQDAIKEFGCLSAAADYIKANKIDAIDVIKAGGKKLLMEARLAGVYKV